MIFGFLRQIFYYQVLVCKALQSYEYSSVTCEILYNLECTQ